MYAGTREILLTQVFPKVGPAELGFCTRLGTINGWRTIKLILQWDLDHQLLRKLNQCQCPGKYSNLIYVYPPPGGYVYPGQPQECINVAPPQRVRLYKVFFRKWIHFQQSCINVPFQGGYVYTGFVKKYCKHILFYHPHSPLSITHVVACIMSPAPTPRTPVVWNTQPLMSSSGPTDSKQVVGWLIDWFLVH